MKNKDITNKEIDEFITRKKLSDIDFDSVVKKDYDVMEDDYEPYVEDPFESEYLFLFINDNDCQIIKSMDTL